MAHALGRLAAAAAGHWKRSLALVVVVLVVVAGERSLQGNAALAETRGAVELQPHVTGVSEVQLSRDERIGFLTVQYDQPAQELQRAPGQRLEAVSAIGERAGLEVSRRGPIVD